MQEGQTPKPKSNGKWPAFYKDIPVSPGDINPNLVMQWTPCNADKVNRFCCPLRMLIAGPSGKFKSNYITVLLI